MAEFSGRGGDFWKLFRTDNAGRNSTNEKHRYTVLNE